MSFNQLARNESLIGLIPNHWKQITLGEACSLAGGGVQTGPFGSQLHASDYVAQGIPSIMPKNIGDNRVVEDDIARITIADAERLSKYRVQTGDIVYSRRGDVEKRALISEYEDGWLCGTGCLRVRFGNGTVLPKYASYYLGHPAVRDWIVRHAVGTTMPNLNTRILSSVPFVLPPPTEQKWIAENLSALDEKIELNRQTNATLEVMAQAIFKEWFVDYNFPGATGELVESGVAGFGRIPPGWRAGAFDELMLLQRGFDLPKKKRIAGEYQVIAASGPSGTHNEFKVRGPGVTTGRSGVLGKVFFSEDDYWPLNTSLWVKRFKIASPIFAYFFLQTLDLISLNGGSAVPTLNRNHVHSLPVLLPPKKIIERFEQLTSTMMSKRRMARLETATLTKIRDTLLPKLMRGEIALDSDV